jgi:hypothetical protein
MNFGGAQTPALLIQPSDVHEPYHGESEATPNTNGVELVKKLNWPIYRRLVDYFDPEFQQHPNSQAAANASLAALQLARSIGEKGTTFDHGTLVLSP